MKINPGCMDKNEYTWSLQQRRSKIKMSQSDVVKVTQGSVISRMSIMTERGHAQMDNCRRFPRDARHWV